MSKYDLLRQEFLKTYHDPKDKPVILLMDNQRNTMTYAQRLELQDTVNDLRHYILPILMQRQDNACALCKQSVAKYDIDHIVYNPMLTINELRALCIPCHKDITDYRHMKHR